MLIIIFPFIIWTSLQFRPPGTATDCSPKVDAQGLTTQAKMLWEIGPVVFHNHAKASAFCCEPLNRD
jgi:hypothetical protein